MRNCASWFALSRAPEWRLMWRAHLSRSDTEPGRIFFTIFIDWIFTSFVERPFTNVFNATSRLNATACLYRACNAD